MIVGVTLRGHPIAHASVLGWPRRATPTILPGEYEGVILSDGKAGLLSLWSRQNPASIQ